jgi:hypothetical protein
MSINFACPNCGKQTVVADQFAGQTGPCSGCGKPVTIPMGMGGPAYAAPPRSSGGGSTLIIILVGALVGGLFVCGIAVALLLPAVQAAREAARRMQSTNNMKQIVLALHNYHDTFGEFPPAVVTDDQGTPLYSGRVLLLPFLEQKPLYDQFNKDKAWDSPENQAISNTSLKMFLDPSNPNNNNSRSDYVFVVGQGTAFEPSPMGRRFADITDGTSNTIGFIETKNGPASWAAPQEWDASSGPIPPGSHPGTTIVGFLDGSVKNVSKNIDPQISKALTTRAGGEPVNGY